MSAVRKELEIAIRYVQDLSKPLTEDDLVSLEEALGFVQALRARGAQIGGNIKELQGAIANGRPALVEPTREHSRGTQLMPTLNGQGQWQSRRGDREPCPGCNKPINPSYMDLHRENFCKVNRPPKVTAYVPCALGCGKTHIDNGIGRAQHNRHHHPEAHAVTSK